jgi:CO/xanthine dehydrogenase Mo-binding subunit
MTVPIDTSSATKRYFGQSIKRREDPKYLTGQSQYTDDLAPSGTLYAAIVRSPYAHARIASINIEEARRRPGVVAAYLASDYPAGLEPGLEEQSFYDPVALTSPFGSYVAVVEVDAETGEITIERFVAVDDCGNIINPLLATGQVHGGLAQGIGQALFEGAEYNEQGQLLTGTLMDYAIPRAEDLPTF